MAYRKPTAELVIITKTYDLILWSCDHTGKVPRNHRFVLGEGIERNLYNLLKTLAVWRQDTGQRHTALKKRLQECMSRVGIDRFHFQNGKEIRHASQS